MNGSTNESGGVKERYVLLGSGHVLNLDLQKEVLSKYQHSLDATLKGCVERKEGMSLTRCSVATEVQITFIRDCSNHNSRIINLEKRHYLEISPATKRWVTIKKLKKNYTNTPHVNLYNEALIFKRFYSETKKATQQRKTLAKSLPYNHIFEIEELLEPCIMEIRILSPHSYQEAPFCLSMRKKKVNQYIA